MMFSIRPQLHFPGISGGCISFSIPVDQGFGNVSAYQRGQSDGHAQSVSANFDQHLHPFRSFAFALSVSKLAMGTRTDQL